MADFCKQCSIVHFGLDHKELAGMSTEVDTANNLYCSAICEGCGFIQVDHEGTCITKGCLVNHAAQMVARELRIETTKRILTEPPDDIDF